MTINIDPELRKAFKAAVALKGLEMSEVVLQFIENFVKQNLPSGLSKKGGQR